MKLGGIKVVETSSIISQISCEESNFDIEGHGVNQSCSGQRLELSVLYIYVARMSSSIKIVTG